MRKLVCLGLVLGLIVGAHAAPAQAAKPKKVSLFLHGNFPIGDMTEFVSNVSDGTTMVMDTMEPAAGAPKSFGVFQPFNEQCTGNPLFASWQAQFTGTIVGPLKLTAHFAAPATQVRVRLWVDIPFSSCTSGAAGVDDYVDPPFETVVDVPPGQNAVDVIFKSKKLPVQGNLVLEISQAGASSQGRVLYDSSTTPSQLQFTAK